MLDLGSSNISPLACRRRLAAIRFRRLGNSRYVQISHFPSEPERHLRALETDAEKARSWLEWASARGWRRLSETEPQERQAGLRLPSFAVLQLRRQSPRALRRATEGAPKARRADRPPWCKAWSMMLLCPPRNRSRFCLNAKLAMDRRSISNYFKRRVRRELCAHAFLGERDDAWIAT